MKIPNTDLYFNDWHVVLGPDFFLVIPDFRREPHHHHSGSIWQGDAADIVCDEKGNITHVSSEATFETRIFLGNISFTRVQGDRFHELIEIGMYTRSPGWKVEKKDNMTICHYVAPDVS